MASPEARARLAAEAALLERRKKDFDRFLKTRERVAAIVALVEKHKLEYDELVKNFRARFEHDRRAA